MKQQLSARDHRMARTICTICLGYLICNMPAIVLKFIRGNDTDDIPYVRLVVSCLFWLQYRYVYVCMDLAPGLREFTSAKRGEGFTQPGAPNHFSGTKPS